MFLSSMLEFLDTSLEDTRTCSTYGIFERVLSRTARVFRLIFGCVLEETRKCLAELGAFLKKRASVSPKCLAEFWMRS